MCRPESDLLHEGVLRQQLGENYQQFRCAAYQTSRTVDYCYLHAIWLSINCLACRTIEQHSNTERRGRVVNTPASYSGVFF
jgi:hypothetical protein